MKKYVIIGNSAAGISAVEAIRELDNESPITVVSDEPTPYYSRCLLPNYVAGEMSKEDLMMRSMEWYESSNIELILGKSIAQVMEKKVVLDSGTLPYDKLLIATGSSPILPRVDFLSGLRTINAI